VSEPTRIKVFRCRITIDENGSRTNMQNRLGSGDEGVRRYDNFIARFGSESQKSKPQGRCTIRYCDAVAYPACLGKLLLEALHVWPTNKACRVEDVRPE
jgi:hypothetical protein